MKENEQINRFTQNTNQFAMKMKIVKELNQLFTVQTGFVSDKQTVIIHLHFHIQHNDSSEHFSTYVCLYFRSWRNSCENVTNFSVFMIDAAQKKKKVLHGTETTPLIYRIYEFSTIYFVHLNGNHECFSVNESNLTHLTISSLRICLNYLIFRPQNINVNALEFVNW